MCIHGNGFSVFPEFDFPPALSFAKMISDNHPKHVPSCKSYGIPVDFFLCYFREFYNEVLRTD